MRKIQSRILVVVLSWGISFAPLAQTCQPNIRESTPTSRFKVNTNGTVLDQKTGLMWKRCTEGLSGADCATGSPAYTDWAGALGWAANSGFAGYKDWRLPNQKELRSLVEVKCYRPAINLTVFPGTSNAGYWSSSPFAYSAIFAWFVGFDLGYSSGNYRNDYNAVRLVRGGQ